jgi:hypothetical protein
LGYPVPDSFRRTRPRFPGQHFDTYVQKANNLQVWNDELEATRRYVLIRVSPEDVVSRVKVVTGDTLARFDTTGTLTQKYQARLIARGAKTELTTNQDTEALRPFVHAPLDLSSARPIDAPRPGQLLPIAVLFERLSQLVGHHFADTGHDQERNRGATLHRLVCQRLGYANYRDSGQFPDVPHQLLEVKLQTSPTIDLGLVRPDGAEALDIPKLAGKRVRHRDVRYGLFYGKIRNGEVWLTHFFLTTGERFFTRFPQFQGKVLNRKLQIPLPAGLLDD